MRVIETIGNIEWMKSVILGGITEQKVRIDWMENSESSQDASYATSKINRWRVKCAFADVSIHCLTQRAAAHSHEFRHTTPSQQEL
jgi:hypothetical protein